jgi:hypothetical protein
MAHLDERLEAAAAELRAAAVSLPERSWGRSAGQRRGRVALVVAGAAVAAFVIVGPLLWLRGGIGDHQGGAGTAPAETSAPALSTVPPTTQPATVTTTSEPETTTTPEAGGEWLSMGEPVADDEYAALEGERPVPGTARRLAWTVGYDGRYTLGLFAAQVDDGQTGLMYCLTFYGSTSEGGLKYFGGGRCATTAERFAEMLAFGVSGSGHCVEPITWMWSVWGVPESVESVVFDLSDGTRLTAETVNGVAQVATGHDVNLRSVSFEGLTAEQLAKIEEFTGTRYMSCAESNDPDLPG